MRGTMLCARNQMWIQPVNKGKAFLLVRIERINMIAMTVFERHILIRLGIIDLEVERTLGLIQVTQRIECWVWSQKCPPSNPSLDVYYEILSKSLTLLFLVFLICKMY